jgi:hypothetical protein
LSFCSILFQFWLTLFVLHDSVHDDVQLCQWLRLSDGRLKLGDFNRAEIMGFDPETQEYCKYNNGACFGNVSMSQAKHLGGMCSTVAV